MRLGLRPSQLHARVKEFSGELAGLIFYSDSLEARQSMLEAVYVLRSAERSLKARANSDVGKEATKGWKEDYKRASSAEGRIVGPSALGRLRWFGIGMFDGL